MQFKDLETENQHLRHLLSQRDETIEKVKFYIKDQLRGACMEDAGFIGHELTQILDGNYDPRKDDNDGPADQEKQRESH